jgi:6-pyruvoyltetrahydropterin/6-carboxytetrahydropterin synthase
MYTVAVQRELIAQHHMISGDFGPENQPHSHHYRVEVRLSGEELDEHGFLVDIEAMYAHLDRVLGPVKDHMLNALPEFQGLNPSIEHLAQILCRAFLTSPDVRKAVLVKVTIWEDNSTWVSYKQRL